MSRTFTFSGVGDTTCNLMSSDSHEEGAWFRVIPINSVNKGVLSTMIEFALDMDHPG